MPLGNAQLSSFHARIAGLALVLVAVAMAAAGGTLVQLYEVAFAEQRTHLAETAGNFASLVEAVARFDERYSGYEEGAWEGTLAQVRSGFSPALSGGMEVVLGRREGNRIRFVWRQRAESAGAPATVPWASPLAEPMRRALAGGRGTVVGNDYQGNQVLAAFVPVPTLDLGLVVKKDLTRVRRPFLQAGLATVGLTALVALVGVVAFFRLVTPVVTRITESEQWFKDLVETSPDWVWEVDANGVYTYASPRVRDLLGYTPSEVLGRTPFDLMPEAEAARLRRQFAAICAAARPFDGLENVNLHKDGHEVVLETSGVPLLDEQGRVRGYRGVDRDVTERRMAEDALRMETEARRQLETIVEGSTAIAFLWRATEGWPVDYVSANVDQLGYTRDDFERGRLSFESLILEEDRKRVADDIQHFTDTGRTRFTQEYRIRTRNGAVRWVDSRTWVRRDETGAVTRYQGVLVDITERKQAEQDLQRANRALSTVSACNEVLVRAATEDALLDGICQAVVEHGGYPLAWIGFKPDHPDSPVLPAAAAGPARGYLEEIEVRFSATDPEGQGPTGTCLRNGTPVVTRDTGNDPNFAPWREAARRHGLRSSIALPLTVEDTVIGCLNIYADRLDAFDATEVGLLTELAADMAFGIKALRTAVERYAAEQELWLAGVQLKTITDRNLDALVVVDPEGFVRFANPAAEALFGRPLNSSDAGPLGLPVATDRWQQIDILRPDNTPAVAEFRAVPIPWEDTDCQLMVLRDVTQRLEMERTIDHLERMETLGSLAAGIVHDIKNMLFPIISLSEMNMRELPEDSRERRRAEKVVQAANRLKDMAVGLLAFSRRSEDQTLQEEVAIHPVVRGALELLRGSLPSTVSVIPDLDEDAGRISVDAARLADAVLNLATNAADAMEGGVGKLWITTGRVTLTDADIPNIVAVPPGDYVRLAVADTGTGMDEKTLKSIFDPFFTTKGEGRGTGLGLPMVMDFARRHEAGLRVTSAPGEGTTFELFFPLVDATPASGGTD